jgi:hypothetical protein
VGGYPSDIEITSDGRLYVVDFGWLNEWLSPDDFVERGICSAIALGEEDTLLTVEREAQGLGIAKRDEAFEVEWQTYYRYNITDEIMSILECKALDFGPDSEVYAIVEAYRIVGRWLLVELGPDGELRSNRTISDDHWPYATSGYKVVLEVGSNGLAYVGLDRFELHLLSTGVYAFQVGQYILPAPDLLTLMVVGRGIIGVVIVIGVYRLGKRV